MDNKGEGYTVFVALHVVELLLKAFQELLNDQRISCHNIILQTTKLIDILLSTYADSESPILPMLGTLSQSLSQLVIMPLNKENGSVQSMSLDRPPVQPDTVSRIAFGSIIGSDDAKQALYENVVLPLSLDKCVREKIFQGIRSTAGNVLLYGPPGTGKTCLAQAAACESNSALFSVRPSEVLSKFQGESERYIASLFQTAREADRAVLFFDEFDSLATCRGSGEDSSQHRRLLAELLLQLTRHKQISTADKDAGAVVVIAATNRLQDLDEAILRRFDCKVYVGAPCGNYRRQMVLSFLSGIWHTLTSSDLTCISQYTDGWTGSEIQSLCREAAMSVYIR